MDAPPIPMPTRRRPASSTGKAGATADTAAPATKIIDVTSRIGRRPNRSASRPANAAPNAAPPKAMLVTTPSIKGERWNAVRRNSSAPEMTPVS